MVSWLGSVCGGMDFKVDLTGVEELHEREQVLIFYREVGIQAVFGHNGQQRR